MRVCVYLYIYISTAIMKNSLKIPQTKQNKTNNRNRTTCESSIPATEQKPRNLNQYAEETFTCDCFQTLTHNSQETVCTPR